MTNEQLRKIDVLIAEHIVELEIIPKEQIKAIRKANFLKYVDEHSHWADCDELGPNPTSIPHYSTDIAAAWDVVEKMRDVIQEVIWDLNEEGEWEYWCMIPDPEDTYIGWQTIFAETAPLAICLAALKAKGIDYEA